VVTGLYPGEPFTTENGRARREHTGRGCWRTVLGRGSAAANRNAFCTIRQPGLAAEPARWLAQLLEQSDTAGTSSIPWGLSNCRRTCRSVLTPMAGPDYNRCQGSFSANCEPDWARKVDLPEPGIPSCAELLPHADLDLTESYFTAVEGARTRFRTWTMREPPGRAFECRWRSWSFRRPAVSQRAIRVHVNYSTPARPEGAARYSWRCRACGITPPTLMVPRTPLASETDLLFAETGAPEQTALAARRRCDYRVFERGVVAVNPVERPGRIRQTETVVPAGPTDSFPGAIERI